MRTTVICTCLRLTHISLTLTKFDSPRNGKNIGPSDFVHALTAGYHLSTFFAWFLTIGTYLLLWQFTKLSLNDIGRHNCIEHDASLAHQNTEIDGEYAPCEVDDALLAALCDDAKTPGKGYARLSAEDIARARVRREKDSPKLSPVQAEVARGEMAIALGVFGREDGSKDSIPVPWLAEWIKDERLPQGWKYTHTQGIFKTIGASNDIRNAMTKMTELQGKITLVGGAPPKALSSIDSNNNSPNKGSSFFSREMHNITPPISVSDDEKLTGRDADY